MKEETDQFSAKASLSDPRDQTVAGKTFVTVFFTPSGRQGKVQLGTTVLDAARRLNVDLDSICGGRGKCGKCQIQVQYGNFSKLQIVSKKGNLSPPNPIEDRFKKTRNLDPTRRLGCNAALLGDALINIPPESQFYRQIIRKRADARNINVNPLIRLYYIEVQKPSLQEPSGDFRRLVESLRTQWSDFDINEDISCDLHILHTLQNVLRDGDWKVTVAIRHKKEIIGIWSGLQTKLLGLAVDIGSTTIAAHLCDLTTGRILASSGAMNTQIRFGEDLMSRVSYLMMHPDGLPELTQSVRETVNLLAKQTTAEIGLTPKEIIDLVFVGNPIMHHLMLGIDPIELGGAPFALTIDRGITVPAAKLDLILHPGASIYALPCIAGHVGADTAAVILSENPNKKNGTTLVIDVGTNAEIILVTNKKIFVCSSPTGPAFEGAQISCGQRASVGAIERVRLDPITLEPTFKVIGSDLWSDNDSFKGKTEKFGVTGICGSGIIELIAQMYIVGILSESGIIKGDMSSVSDRIAANGRTFSYRITKDLTISQNDIRAIQLAKAALHASFRLLMQHAGIKKVDRILLAGAFGSHIDPKYAMILGMVPDCPLTNVLSVGNAAGTGARIALLDYESRSYIEKLVLTIEKIETAVEPLFQQYFVEAMAIPHKTDPYNILRSSIDLPILSNCSIGRRKNRKK